MRSENPPAPSASPCSVQPRVETSWLALPLSARGLVDELAKYADENAHIILRLDEAAHADAVGKEVARLLCAHPGELARVRRDTKKLLDEGILAIEGSAIRLSRVPNGTVRAVERPRAMTDAERAQLHRDRQKALRDQELGSSRNVTIERDGFRDDRHDATVTSSLSFQKDLDLKSSKERETVTRIVTATRDAVPEELNEARRAKAKQLGLQDHRIHLVWAGFVPKHAGQKKTELEWDNRWAWWVTNQLLLESARAPAPAKGSGKTVDVEAPWIREAMGDT